MKILLVTHENPETPFGGLGIFIREFSRHLKIYAEVKVLHLDYENQCSTLTPPEGVDWVLQPKREYPSDTPEVKALDLAHSFLTQAQGLLSEFQPDVIHCNDRQSFLPFREFPNVVYSSHLVFTDLCGRPGWDDNLNLEHKYETWAVRKAQYVICYSQFQRKVIQGRVDPQSRPLVLPLGADLRAFYRSERIKKPIQIIFYGRMEGMQKGFDHFIAAAKRLRIELGERISFRCYGRGQLPEDFPKDIFDEVEFLDGEDKLKALSETDIMVMPSTYEPFGLAGLEALASGCLLLATEGLGMDEYLMPGENYVPIQPAEASIRTSLLKVIQNWEQYQGIRDNAQASVAKWTWDRSVRAHLPIYESVMAKDNRYGLISSPKALGYQEHYKTFWNSDISYIPDVLKVYLRETIPKDAWVPFAFPWERGVWNTMDNSNNVLEYLPYGAGEMETVILAGKLEFSFEPGLALKEALRITGDRLYLLVSLGLTMDRQRVAFDSIDEVKLWLKKVANSCHVDFLKTFDAQGYPIPTLDLKAGWALIQFTIKHDSPTQILCENNSIGSFL